MELTQEILKELLHYNPKTGIFTWKERDIKWFKKECHWKIWNKNFAGLVCGWTFNAKDGKSYKIISIFSSNYRSHRLAFLYINGQWPLLEVDHIDGNGLNNEWTNLREASSQENSKNHKLSNKNTSGYHGIHKDKSNKYIARINDLNGKRLYLGYFDTLEEAVVVRKEAEIKYNYHPNHGRK